MQKILIVVDMQNDFVTGPLGSEAAQVAAKNIAAHINEYDTVIFTRDTHGPDYLDTLEGKFLPVPHCIEEDGSFNPYTRDTFGIAVKATYAEDANGKPIMIYKQPKALSWKKSQKGCCRVALDGQSYEDELTWADHLGEDNLLQPVFRDGSMIKEGTLHDIRARLYKEGF